MLAKGLKYETLAWAPVATVTVKQPRSFYEVGLTKWRVFVTRFEDGVRNIKSELFRLTRVS